MVNKLLLDVAYGRAPADVIIANGQLVNVLTEEIYPADVAIVDGRVAFVGDAADMGLRRGPDTATIDAQGRFLTPGLIDGHLHIECSKLSITMFADLVGRYGTTSAISGLDQILVVNGLDGVKEFLAEAAASPLRVHWGAPTKAPYTVPESNVGHRFGPAEHAIAQQMPECVGLWETVQEFVEGSDAEYFEVFDMAERNRLKIFGCAPLSDHRRISGLAAIGTAVDHESYSPEEELIKLRNGIGVLIRQSEAAPFLKENIKVVTELGAPAHKIGFVTDDVNAYDVLGNDGHLDKMVRLAIEYGVTPMQALQMATINTATYFGLDTKIGCIAPGRYADILLVDDLTDFRAHTVISGGKVAFVEGKALTPPVPPARSAMLHDTIVIPELTGDDFVPKADGKRAKVLTMCLDPDVMFVRKRQDFWLDVVDGRIVPDTDQDVLYVSIVERYGKTGNHPTAFIHGFGLKSGALATTAAPDDNNIVVIGANADDMAVAVRRIKELGGGQVVVAGGEVLAEIALPIAGIVADIPAEQMLAAETRLNQTMHALGSKLALPLWYSMFVMITSIPDWAITDLGLVDCIELKIVDPILEVEK